jgi:hypothetical protein
MRWFPWLWYSGFSWFHHHAGGTGGGANSASGVFRSGDGGGTGSSTSGGWALPPSAVPAAAVQRQPSWGLTSPKEGRSHHHAHGHSHAGHTTHHSHSISRHVSPSRLHAGSLASSMEGLVLQGGAPGTAMTGTAVTPLTFPNSTSSGRWTTNVHQHQYQQQIWAGLAHVVAGLDAALGRLDVCRAQASVRPDLDFIMAQVGRRYHMHSWCGMTTCVVAFGVKSGVIGLDLSFTMAQVGGQEKQ